MLEAKRRFEQMNGLQRMDEVKSDFSNLATCQADMRGCDMLNCWLLLMTWLASPAEDEVARKYGWEDVYQGRNPNQQQKGQATQL